MGVNGSSECHGICYGFEVMRSCESPKHPFSKFTIISSLPCLHTFWHAIPTSLFFKSCNKFIKINSV